MRFYFESVHNVDTLWTDYLKNRIFAAFRRENARSVRKVTDFVDRHYFGNNKTCVFITRETPVIDKISGDLNTKIAGNTLIVAMDILINIIKGRIQCV